MTGAEPPELPAPAPPAYEERRISPVAVRALGWSIVSLASGLGWGLVVAASVTMITVIPGVNNLLRVAIPVFVCALFGALLHRSTREYPTQERVALLAGYGIAAGLAAWFLLRVVWE